MNDFFWECKTKVRFGQGAVREYLAGFVREFAPEGGNIMIGYGGGSVKRNGSYDDVVAVLLSSALSGKGGILFVRKEAIARHTRWCC